MTNRRTNLIKGQSEDALKKTETESTCFAPRLIPKSIKFDNVDGTHKEAMEFFGNLRKTCRNNESGGE